MAGNILAPKRPRYQSNERFDTADADVASRSPRQHITSLARAALSTPRATAATAVGTIISGFTLTLNPTGGSDAKVRINTEAAVGLDSDGGMLIKPAGTTLDTVIPAGQHQLYVYYQETETDNAKRRFLPAAAPYTEFTAAINTALQGTINTYVRAGGLGTTIAEDNVNGTTVPLLLVGIVTNTAGAITCTGYNATTAPNGSDITNRLTAAVAPSTQPALNTRNGSIQTLHDMAQVLAHNLGQSVWTASAALVPAAGNNFGAYTLPTQGIQKVRERFEALITNGGLTTGAFDLRPVGESTYVPLMAFRDWNGKLHAAVDHLGYRNGQISEWDEHWRTTGTTEPVCWSFSSGAGGTRSYNNPATTGSPSALNQRNVTLVAPATNGLADLTTEHLLFWDDDTAFVIDFLLRTNTLGSGVGTAARLTCGWDCGSNDFGFFGDLGANANWVAGTGAGTTSTGVALVADTLYRMRIELIGNNVTSLASTELRFFINGTMVHSQAYPGPATPAIMRLHFFVSHPGATVGNYGMTIGRIRCSWNHLATSDNI